MTSIVVDTSIVVKWFSAVKEENVIEADEIQEEIISDNLNALYPKIILLELANVLKFSKGFNEKDCSQAITDFKSLPLDLVEIPETKELITIMYRHNITSYDAVFVALAVYKNIPLITADYKHHKKEISENIIWLSEWKRGR